MAPASPYLAKSWQSRHWQSLHGTNVETLETYSNRPVAQSQVMVVWIMYVDGGCSWKAQRDIKTSNILPPEPSWCIWGIFPLCISMFILQRRSVESSQAWMLQDSSRCKVLQHYTSRHTFSAINARHLSSVGSSNATCHCSARPAGRSLDVCALQGTSVFGPRSKPVQIDPGKPVDGRMWQSFEQRRGVWPAYKT